MSISDDLMWRYYELLTDLSVAEITTMRESAGRGESNPRDIKIELAKRIITDFHSVAAARAAEDEFNRIFRSKEIPAVVETRDVKAGVWPLPQLLVETGLAESKAEARRLIEQGGVRIGGVRQGDPGIVIGIKSGEEPLLQVGKRRFLRLHAI
jgi:tyrosyl-tRNA synthetase